MKIDAELKLKKQGYKKIVGIDEAGRGCLVGPVFAAAVILDFENLSMEELNLINDSKKISKKKREIIAEVIKQHSKYNVAIASVEEIDKINILNASMLAMERAIEGLEGDYVLVDGNKMPNIGGIKGEAIVKGDSKVISIAAASILAKVAKDNYLAILAKEFPEFNWDKNSGYPVKEHLEAMKKFGITKYHRKSYKPVQNLLKS